ncbi:MAG: oxygenase MpaB family protein [Nannocystaceae bacterium]
MAIDEPTDGDRGGAPAFPPGFIPSRHGASRARARELVGPLRLLLRGDPEPSPARWRAIGEGLMRGDPAMDRLVAWMFERGYARARPLFERALELGIDAVEDPPEPLRELFALVDRRPAWLDMDKLEAGARVMARGGFDYFLVDRDLALMGGYQASAFNKALLMTGALEKGASKRVAETAQWYLDCTAPGGMRPGGVGFKSTLRVRLIHALVRRHLGARPQWRAAEWGLPVNQTDMAATALAFPMVMLVGGRALWVLISGRDADAAMHHGRYVGWLMGVEEAWLPTSEREALTLLYHLSLSITDPDETSVQLGRALMDEPLQRPYPWPRGLRGRYERARHLSVTRFFLGRQAMRNLGLPEDTIPWYPLLRAPTNALRHLVAALIPGGRERLARRGRQEVLEVLASMSGPGGARIGDAFRHLEDGGRRPPPSRA